MSGRLCRIDQNTIWLVEVPNHEGYRMTPMVSPQLCPGAQLEFYVGEFQPNTGKALDHVHAKEDHVFYVLSGEASARVGDQIYLLQPGDVLWVPKGVVHNFEVTGEEAFRIIAVFAPSRNA